MTTSTADRRYWLLKTEPSTFSFDDLWNAPKRTTFWDGVRNFQARNTMRDLMKPGDLVFIYHSSTDPTGIAGIAEVVKGGYPDPTAFDPKDSHYDPKSKRESPSWFGVDVKAVKRLPEIITLERLRKTKGLEKMVLLQKGSRLSVQPVSADEWQVISRLAGINFE
jgi:predicted RNA-binding protein with PUA-like domain